MVTAEPGADYYLLNSYIEAISTLHDADNNLCFDVTIIQDEFLEYEEYFVTAISLPDLVSGGLMVEIAGGKETAHVYIENDDSKLYYIYKLPTFIVTMILFEMFTAKLSCDQIDMTCHSIIYNTFILSQASKLGLYHLVVIVVFHITCLEIGWSSGM